MNLGTIYKEPLICSGEKWNRFMQEIDSGKLIQVLLD